MLIPNPHNIGIADWPFTFRCPSTRKNVLPYLVNRRTLRCDCPAGKCRTPCKHVRWVVDYWDNIMVEATYRMTLTEGGWKLLRAIQEFLTK